MKKLYFAFVAVFVLLAGCSSGEDDPREDGVEGTFELHSFLQDGMVIQQNRPFRLWGKASAANVKITAKASWARQEYTCRLMRTGRGCWKFRCLRRLPTTLRSRSWFRRRSGKRFCATC
ncbi:hypothetical protein [Alistipes senegalensis]|uniref:hypothetical protein n=1 Tax=Alistipes senegalensis TaxID=1288121 RepID=UPI00248E3F11|nr:hypothetical protein [Alistipes senegalensis]